MPKDINMESKEEKCCECDEPLVLDEDRRGNARKICTNIDCERYGKFDD